MNFRHYDLGEVASGQMVEIKLSGNAANVRLMDEANFERYKKNNQYGFIGGRANQSPVLLQIPIDGHWHVVIDMIGLRGSVKTAYRLLSSKTPLKPYKLKSERKQDYTATHETEIHIVEHDVFFIYADEDIDTVVNPIRETMIEQGLKVMSDGMEMKENAILRHMIDIGLACSKMALVVLSPGLMTLSAAANDQEMVITKAVNGEQLVTLIKHNIAFNKIAERYPMLANHPMLDTEEFALDDIATRIVKTININKQIFK